MRGRHRAGEPDDWGGVAEIERGFAKPEDQHKKDEDATSVLVDFWGQRGATLRRARAVPRLKLFTLDEVDDIPVDLESLSADKGH